MSNKEAAKLIIENIQMLDDAMTPLNDVTVEIYAEIDQFIENSINDFDGDWFGKFESLNDVGWAFFAPTEWRVGDDDSEEGLAFYYLGWKSNSNIEDNWALTSLFPGAKQSLCFLMELDWSQFQNKPTKKLWRAFTAQANLAHPEIEQLGFGFVPEDGHWFLRFHLDPKQIANNYMTDTLEDAFPPIAAALAKLQKAHACFEKIVEEAKVKFGVPVNEPEDDTSL